MQKPSNRCVRHEMFQQIQISPLYQIIVYFEILVQWHRRNISASTYAQLTFSPSQNISCASLLLASHNSTVSANAEEDRGS